MSLHRVLDFGIAPELLDLPLADLPLRAGTRRALMLGGVSTLKDLENVPAGALSALSGLQADVLDEIRRAVSSLVVPVGGSFELLKRAPVDRLAIGSRLVDVLRDVGCESVADVLIARRDRLASATGSESRADAVRDHARRIASLPAERLISVTWPATPDAFALPRVDVMILRAVALAESAEEEIYGLVLGPPLRDSLLLLRRWGLTSWPPPSLDALAAAEGVTREGVRQIIARHEDMLGSSGLRLPKTQEALRLWAERGFSLDLHEVVRRARHRGGDLTVPVLRTLPSLLPLGLIRRGSSALEHRA
jgi:hypothetical protein